MHASPEATDLAELTRDLLQPFGSAATRAGVTLETRLDPDLGIVEIDPELWEKIVLNLVANAIKFTPEGSIEVTLTRADDRILLRVADTGVGIPDAEVDLVFDRFHRVHESGGRSIEGTGIGLSIVAEAARALDGIVAATSQVGAGSAFEVTVPLVAGLELAEQAWTPHAAVGEALARDAVAGGFTPAPARTVARGAEDRASILVAEDNAALRSRLARVLGGARRRVDGSRRSRCAGRAPVERRSTWS